MNDQQILDNAPKGATNIDSDYDYWLMSKNDRPEIFDSKSGEWFLGSFYDVLLMRSLTDIKRIAELDATIDAMVTKASAKPRPSYDEQQRQIAELDKELATSTPPPNLIWFDRSEVLGLDPEQTGVIDLRGMKLEQQRKGFWLGFEDARCHPDEMNILSQWESTKAFNQAKETLKEQGE